MWDDNNQDKQMMRNQFIAIILMTVLVFAWFTFFVPKRPPVEQPASQTGQEASEAPQAEEEEVAAPSPVAARPAGVGEGEFSLPPRAVQEDPAQDEATLENEQLKLVFTRIGARLKRAYVKLERGAMIQLVPEPHEITQDTQTVYPLGLRFTGESIQDELDWLRYDVTHDEAQESLTFTLRLPAFEVRKRFRLSKAPYVVDVEVAVTGLGDRPVVLGMDETPAYMLNWGPNVSSADLAKGVKQTLVMRVDGRNESVKTSDFAGDGEKAVWDFVPDANWVAVKSAYFVVALRPENFESARAWAVGQDSRFRFGLAVPRFEVLPEQTDQRAFRLYIGPSKLDTLEAAWPTLATVQRFFSHFDLMDWFAKLLLRILNFFYLIVPNYGVAIILLTVLVRMAMFPLTLKSMRNMKRMQLLAPEIEQLKAKYGEDQQEMTKRMMELYRERGINPVSGCLPLILQMPVFIALYRMLWSAYELRGAPFVLIKWGDYRWISDLSEPDHFLHLPWMEVVPIVGSALVYLNLLPILMGLSMVVSQKVMPTSGPAQTSQQKMLMTIMPVFFAVICYNMAAGLSLYILTSTVLGIFQQFLTPVAQGKVEAPQKKKPSKKPQHFYTAAKARQRERAKEAKRAKMKTKSRQVAPHPNNARDPASLRSLLQKILRKE